MGEFPIDTTEYTPLTISHSQRLTPEQQAQYQKNIEIVRDSIVFFTALAGAKGLGGHTGGAYDIVPEVLYVDGLIRGNNDIYPVTFDEAGHRVAIQYAMAALNGHIPLEQLLHYREFGGKLPGHPERGMTPGVDFSSGRLGHLWSYVNGIALRHRGKTLVLFGSDGSQMEGSDAEAARLAVAKKLNVKLLIDDNNVTITGHPTHYLPGFSLESTLKGHGLTVTVGNGEHLDSLSKRIHSALHTCGPVALINKRHMAQGIPGIGGTTKGHDVIPVKIAIEYLSANGHTAAVEMLKAAKKPKAQIAFPGSSQEWRKNRDEFGMAVCDILEKKNAKERQQQVMVIDSDLAGSCGLHYIQKQFPDVFVSGGVMERGNYSTAAGFGSEPGRQGIFATFSAFLEMVVSEITMARLNYSNVLAHFSHAGVDDMGDNTCHFGTNIFFAHNGFPEEDNTRLYFPADGHQMKAVVEKVFHDPGLRFVFSTRSAVPYICREDGSHFFDREDGYQFTGKDEIIREGTDGHIVSYGEMLYRCLDAVEQLREYGVNLGLINKPTLNVVDEESMAKLGKSDFVLVVESQNYNTGLGSRFGTWLLERGHAPTYAHMGVTRVGDGGLTEQIPHQGLNPKAIMRKVESLI